jgi:Bacterial membrane protein YfhO
MNDPTLKNETGIIQMLRSPVWLKAGPPLFFTALFVLFFSPVIFTGYLLAPNDGLNYSLPNFYSPRTLWTNLLFSGYPVAADPQAQTWYPLAFLFSLFPNSWNAYMVSAYVLSACFMFGYVWTITQSRMAGLIAGIGYSMSGFMIGRLGQVPLIHAAVWLPLIFWTIEKNRQKPSTSWIAIGSLAIACSFLGGHTQIVFFGLVVAGAYSVYTGWNPAPQRWVCIRHFAWMVLIGIGLVAVQLLPTMELAAWSARAKLSYSEFVRFSLSPAEVLTLLFPYLFGGGGTLYDVQYFGSGNGMELPGYLGLLTLLLACLAVVGSRANRIVRFWWVTFIIAFVMALGEHTPLSQLMYYLPGFNKFRAPLRHFLEISLAVSVLAGLGADCIQRRKISANQIKGTILGAAGILGLSLAMIWVFSDTLEQAAIQKSVESLNVVSWTNAALWVPVLVLTLTVGALAFWWNRPGGLGRRFLILTVLVVDLGSFGWFHNWRYFVPPEQWIQPPEVATKYRKILNESHQRMAPVKGLHSDRNQLPVNISRLWGIPSSTGYNPLVLSRVNEILSRYETGALLDTWSSVKHRALDILGVRYLFLPSAYMETFTAREKLQWTRENLGVRLGSGCNQAYPSSIEFFLPQGFSASHIGIVSKSFCVRDISDGEAVLSIRLSGDNNLKRQADFVMGRDTAEWGYDCSGIREQVRHKQASVFQSFPISDSAGAPCHGYQYVTRMPVSPAHSWKRIQVEWLGKPGIVQLDKITLVDEKSGHVLPLRELTASNHWRFKERIGKTVVYENLDAMPRAWLVPEAVPARPQDILHAIYYSKLPDGRPFDPAKTALLEGSYAFQAPSFDPSGKVDIVRLEDTEIVLQTQSLSDSFLVTSDIYYPGWEATIDGQPAPLYRTDYVLRGISLPAGSHEVRFEYHPQPFYTGMTITLLSLLILVLWVFWPFPRNNT